MDLSAPIHRLKRAARDHARARAIPLHSALDQVAASEGYSSWSLLAARHAEASSDPRHVFQLPEPGELVLVAARPFQGKTKFALRLALSAIAEGHEAHFFSLDYTPRDVGERLARLPAKLARHAPKLGVDCSDAIAADYIIKNLVDAKRGTVVAVDYLQLLDQKRTSPPLQDQIAALANFAREGGLGMVFICQIDRSFESRSSPMPGLGDIRLPNPLDLRLFSRVVFLHAGHLRMLDTPN